MKLTHLIRRAWSPAQEDIKDTPRWLVVFAMRFAMIAFALAILLIPLAAYQAYDYKHTRVRHGSVHWDEHFIECRDCSENRCEALCREKCSRDEHDIMRISRMNTTSCGCVCISISRDCVFCEQDTDLMELSEWLRGE